MVKMNTIKIRLADIGDASAIAELSGQLDYPTSIQQAEKRLRTILESKEHVVFAACAAEEVVGWLHVFLAIRVESDPFAELGGFVVAKKHRRRGAGRRLLEAAEDWAVSHGVAKLRVRSRSSRLDARVFYENLGFSITKEQKVFDKLLFY